MSVLLGNGDGTFQPPSVDFAGGAHPRSVAVADFNGDGKPDLAVANAGSDTVSVLLGNGNGTFAAPGRLPGGDGPVLGRGGRPERRRQARPRRRELRQRHRERAAQQRQRHLRRRGSTTATGATPRRSRRRTSTATASPTSPSRTRRQHRERAARQRRRHLRRRRSTYAAGDGPDSVAAADLNGDGKPDLAVANCDSDTVSVLLNNGNGTFAATVDYPTGDEPRLGRGGGPERRRQARPRRRELRQQHRERAAEQRQRHLRRRRSTTPRARAPPRSRRRT